MSLEHPAFTGYDDRSLPRTAKLRLTHTVQRSSMPSGEAELLATGAGVRVLNYEHTRTQTFYDADHPGRGPFRLVGGLVWNPLLGRLTAWLLVGAGGADAATLLEYAAERALRGVPGPRVDEREQWRRFVNAGGFPGIFAKVARPLGDDELEEARTADALSVPDDLRSLATNALELA